MIFRERLLVAFTWSVEVFRRYKCMCADKAIEGVGVQAPSTPEARLLDDLNSKWEVSGDIPPEAIAQFKILADLAVQSSRVKPHVAGWMVKIVEVNPHRRLSRLGQRISLVEEVIRDMQAADSRLTAAVGYLRHEHDILQRVVDAHPMWKKGDEEFS